MGLTLTAVSRLLGPAMVKSVAVTGSDPDFRTGTDVAVLFETDDPVALKKMLLAQISMKVRGAQSVTWVKGTMGELA